MGKSLDSSTLFRIITEQIRAGNMHVTAGLVRKLIEDAGFEESLKEWGLESFIGDARELMELEKQPRRAAPPLVARTSRIDELQRAYPFLSGWTASCPNGWLGLLEQACGHIVTIAPREQLAKLRTAQLKEKFGTLRWYLEGNFPRITSTAMAAGMLSASLCAACGDTGTMRNHEGWYITLCDACSDLPYPDLLLAIDEDWC